MSRETNAEGLPSFSSRAASVRETRSTPHTDTNLRAVRHLGSSLVSVSDRRTMKVRHTFRLFTNERHPLLLRRPEASGMIRK